MTTFNFTDRASYLAWRAEWKANYATISTTIRHLKGERSETNSAWDKQEGGADSHELYRKFRIAYTALARMQSDAREALETLKEAKEVSWNMRSLAMNEIAKDHNKDLQEPVLS